MKLLSKKQVKSIIYKDKTKTYTYGLCRDGGELFYVGVGIKNRVLQHVMNFNLISDSNKLKTNIIKKQNSIQYVIFLVHSDRNICLALEGELIKAFGRIDTNTGILCNLTDGGEIGPTGVKVTENTKAKLREIRQGASNLLSNRNKEYWNSLSEETKKEQILKMRSNTQSPEARKKRGDEHKRKWADPEFREKMLQSRKLSRQQKLSQSLKE